MEEIRGEEWKEARERENEGKRESISISLFGLTWNSYFFPLIPFPPPPFFSLFLQIKHAIKVKNMQIWFAYLILLLKEVMCKKEGMIIPQVLPFQSLAILFYRIYQEEKYTCTRKISKNTFSWLPYLPDYQIKLTTKSILPSEKV